MNTLVHSFHCKPKIVAIDEHNFLFIREQVRKALRQLDPEGVDLRLKHRLKRRQYVNKVRSDFVAL